MDKTMCFVFKPLVYMQCQLGK